jgi:hypothetical protein
MGVHGREGGMTMQFDGFAVEKWRAQFTGAIEIEEREGLAMRTDKVVVMVVATRIRKSIPEPLDEDGTMRITRQNKIEHLAVLEGDLREQALTLLATGSERGFQGTLLAGLEPEVDPETGEITSGMAPYAAPMAKEPVTGLTDEELAALDREYHDDEPDDEPDSIFTPPEPARILNNDDDPEYFDVPPIKDDSQPVGTGPIKKPGARPNGTSSEGDGPRVAPVDYAELQSFGTSDGAPNGSGAPIGEVVGRVRGPRKDKALEDFFNEENP